MGSSQPPPLWKGEKKKLILRCDFVFFVHPWYATYLYFSKNILYSSLSADEKGVALGARKVTPLLVETSVPGINKVHSYIE